MQFLSKSFIFISYIYLFKRFSSLININSEYLELPSLNLEFVIHDLNNCQSPNFICIASRSSLKSQVINTRPLMLFSRIRSRYDGMRLVSIPSISVNYNRKKSIVYFGIGIFFLFTGMATVMKWSQEISQVKKKKNSYLASFILTKISLFFIEF